MRADLWSEIMVTEEMVPIPSREIGTFKPGSYIQRKYLPGMKKNQDIFRKRKTKGIRTLLCLDKKKLKFNESFCMKHTQLESSEGIVWI